MEEVTDKKELREGLKSQLRFRKTVLQQKSQNPKLFNFTTVPENGKRRDKTLEELANDLKVLIKEAQQMKAQYDRSFLVGHHITHFFMVDGRKTPFEGIIISQVGHNNLCITF